MHNELHSQKNTEGEVITPPPTHTHPHPSRTCLFGGGCAQVGQTGAKVSHLCAGLLVHFVRKQTGRREGGGGGGSALAWTRLPPRTERGLCVFQPRFCRMFPVAAAPGG